MSRAGVFVAPPALVYVHTVRHCTQTVKGVREIDNDSHLTVLNQPSADPGFERLPPSPISGYSLTKEQASRGGKATAERARRAREERRMTALERINRDIEEQHERVMAVYWAAIDAGDWRAAEALLDRTYGKATQRQEIEDVTDRGLDTEADLGALEELEAEMKRRKAA